MKKRLNLAAILSVSLLVATAIARELPRPAAERQWQGRVAGIPSHFTQPTRQRIRTEYWNPQSKRILSPYAFSMGYGINIAALGQRARAFSTSSGRP